MFRTSRIIRYINQNRRKIIFVISIILGVILVIQLLNTFAKRQMEKASNDSTISATENQKVYRPNETVLMNTTVEEKQSEQNTEIIDNFVQYCNNGEIQKAYDLLSEECKEEVYPTLERFENNYYENMFKTKKEYNIQSWMTANDSYTYRIRYTEDIMSSGQYNASETLEDYITIVEKDNEVKLNINYYVGREEVNETQEKDGIAITVVNRENYIEYEKYTIKIENTTDKKVMLDDLKTVDGIKLFGEDDVEYQAVTNELSRSRLTVENNMTRTIQIKFAKGYNPRREDQKISFFNITLSEEKNKEEEVEENNQEENEVDSLAIEIKLK